jgi:copper chaperone NosL
MKKIAVYWQLLLASLAFACSTEPRAIHFGVDMCHHCKMTLMDPLFGAEIVTNTGKVLVFDDLNCLVGYLEEASGHTAAAAQILVVDHKRGQVLIDARSAHYVHSEEIRSPMASQLAAFASREDMEAYGAQYKGVYLRWPEVLTQFK